jgi:hypothetical protein
MMKLRLTTVGVSYVKLLSKLHLGTKDTVIIRSVWIIGKVLVVIEKLRLLLVNA